MIWYNLWSVDHTSRHSQLFLCSGFHMAEIKGCVLPFHYRAVFHSTDSGGRIYFQIHSGYWPNSVIREGADEASVPLMVVMWEAPSPPSASSSHCLLHLQTNHGILRLVFVWIIRGQKSWGCIFRILPTRLGETKNKMNNFMCDSDRYHRKVRQGRQRELSKAVCVFDGVPDGEGDGPQGYLEDKLSR